MNQAYPGQHIMPASSQPAQHSLRVRKVARLAENDAVEHDLRVRADDQRFAVTTGDRAGFALGVLHHEHVRRGAVRDFLDAVRSDDAEAQPHVAEQLFPAWRGAGEDDFGFVQRRHGRYLFSETMTKVEHLYIHVPFCAAKCHYCAFYSEPGSIKKMTGYVDSLLRELDRFAPQLAPQTTFFGGGTPSLLPVPLMRRILKPLSPGREWTMECNPSTISTEKAKLYRDAGVNRLSMGVQALDDEMLDVLGRVHSVEGAVASFQRLRDAGFDNINLDLIFGLPGQTMQRWQETLGKVIDLQPEHVSTYCLILEEDTHFWSLLQQGHIKPDDELELAMYQTSVEMLSTAGYRQYEISNFAKPGRECAHNIAYWEGKDYIGLGPSACSTVRDRRWQNASQLENWTVASEEILTPELRAAERVAFGMRMNAGVPAELVRGRWDHEVTELLNAKLVQWRDGRLTPTSRGILFADEVAAAFF
jgi:oxygen-independent coproporphyrinogen-3 oxidase